MCKRFRLLKSSFKSAVLILVVSICSLTSLSAFSIDLAPINPLFREPLVDPFSDSTSFRYLKVLDDGLPESILVADKNTQKYERYPHDTRGLDEYWQMKTAANIGLLRFSTKYFELEGYIQGGINTVFQRKGGIDCLGFDGMYGAGASVRIAKTIVLRAGFHHFSGHWGDEIIENALELDPTLDFYSSPAKDKHLVEYTRGNSWMAGISVEPTEQYRFYLIAEMPMKRAWIRPGIHVPPYVLRPGSGEVDQFQNMTGQEGITGLTSYDPAYKAWRFQAGGELRQPVFDLGSLFVAGEIQAHQDGKTLHQVGGYDPKNPWEFEYTVGAGFEFGVGHNERKFRLEVNYHDGRFPLLNYFFQRSKYVVIGLGISG